MVSAVTVFGATSFIIHTPQHLNDLPADFLHMVRPKAVQLQLGASKSFHVNKDALMDRQKYRNKLTLSTVFMAIWAEHEWSAMKRRTSTSVLIGFKHRCYFYGVESFFAFEMCGGALVLWWLLICGSTAMERHPLAFVNLSGQLRQNSLTRFYE